MGNDDPAYRVTGTGDVESVEHGLFAANRFEDGINAVAASQVAHALDSLFTALADDVGCAKCFGQGDASRVATQDDNLLGAEPLSGDDAAESDRPVAAHGHFSA